MLSQKAFNQHGQSVMAMITSAPSTWPGDCRVEDLPSAGLPHPCVVRLKLFTLDNRLIVKHVGHLSHQDSDRVASELRAILPF